MPISQVVEYVADYDRYLIILDSGAEIATRPEKIRLIEEQLTETEC